MMNWELWLRKRPWLIWGIRGILWFVAFVWIFAFSGAIQRDKARVVREEAYFQKHRSQLSVRQREQELSHKASEFFLKARRQGLTYGPRQYFTELRTLESQARKDHVQMDRVLPRTEAMYNLMVRHCKIPPAGFEDREAVQKYMKDPRKWTTRDLHDARKYYQTVQNFSDEDLVQDKKDVINLSRNQKIWWLMLAWFRGMPVMMLIFLLRMVEKRGILATILADKRAFWRAVVDWPIFVFQYPDNVVKEVMVEAELRRIGSLFRRLNPVERLAVYEIASASDFKKRLRALREVHQPEYQRGLAVAMLATLFCLLFLPYAQAQTTKTKAASHGVVIAMARDGLTAQITLASDHSPPPGDWGKEANHPELDWELAFESEPLGLRKIRLLREDVLQGIDHVPNIILVGERRRFVVQKQGEINDVQDDGRGCTAVHRSVGYLARASVGD